MNSDVVGELGKTDAWGKELTQEAQKAGADPYALFEAWRATGDKHYLETLYGNQIQRGSQRMYMMTDGEWWSDRIDYQTEGLQRSRLGGVALVRNQITPGHLVSWRFEAPASAASVALLVTQARPDRLKVVAFNLEGPAGHRDHDVVGPAARNVAHDIGHRRRWRRTPRMGRTAGATLISRGAAASP